MTVDISGMTVTPVLTGLPSTPVAAKFAADGRIYVAIKQGKVLMYDGAGDTTPVTTLDIQTDTMSYADRGLLGLALDPAFNTGRPYIYVLYTYDRDPFGTTTVPRWGDSCPSPPGGSTDGCTVSARVDRYSVNSNGVASGPPLRLLDGADGPLGGWCNQFSSHAIGTLAFGADNMLYVGSGDGASFNYADYGQSGGSLVNTPTPANPCNDKQGTSTHSGGRGTPLGASDSRGGALRSQAVRGAFDGEYVTWDGAILRINPDTGAAAAGNPLVGNGISGDDRIVAYGLRNPFRFNLKPGTNQLWLGDVGWNTYEEIDRFDTGPTQTTVPNFGWPCYEGPGTVSPYDNLNISLCETLYTNNVASLGGVSSSLVAPTYSWRRINNAGALPCGPAASGGGGAATGGAFVTNSQWPAALQGAYVFGDYARQCIAVLPMINGQPDTANVTSIVSGVFPVDIQNGPGGDVYWIDIVNNALNRIRPVSGNLPPVASFTATPPSGVTPLNVVFNASGATDPNQAEVLTYTWDLDGDGQCDDGSGVTINRIYSAPGAVTVKLCVADQIGATDTTTRQIQPGNTPPVITSFTTSADANGWKVGDNITFSAAATDNSGALPASAYTWKLDLRHCMSEARDGCHTHPQTAPPAGKTGSFPAPDHEYYAFMQLTVTVTDSDGLTTTQVKDVLPRVSTVTLQTVPAGVDVAVGTVAGISPLTTKFLENGVVQLVAPATETVGGVTKTFAAWADSASAPATRTVNAPAGNSTFTALYTPDSPPTIVSATATPDRLDSRIDGTITVSGTITDDAGVVSVVAHAVGDDGAIHSAPLSQQSGGIWRGDVELPLNSAPGSYAVTVDATDAAGNITTVSANPVLVVWTQVEPPPTGGRAAGFTAIPPRRVLDTRNGTGAPTAPLAPGAELRLQIGGTPGIDPNATGVVVNVAAVDAEGLGFVTVYPCGAVPVVSNLNLQTGLTSANLAIVDLDPTGAICFFGSQRTDLVADVTAVIVPGANGYSGIAPVRVVDTRIGTGLGAVPLEPGQIAEIPLGAASVPAGASGVVANLTVTEPDAAGYLTAFPCGGDAPLASNVNFAGGQTVSNLILTDLDDDQHLCVTTNATIHLVIDVSGWLTPDGGTPQLVVPFRALDTRTTTGLTAGETLQIGASGLGAPADATAVIANVTAVDPAAAGFLTVAPCEAAAAATSNVNYGAGETRPVLTMTTFGPSRSMCVHASQPMNVIIDVQGYVTAV